MPERWAPPLPPGRHVDLPGRGTTFVRELPGPAGAATIVLLHGWTATADLNWFTAMGTLGRSFRVLAMDHRGHGRGIRSRRRFRLADCADDVAALADELDIGSVIPVGYSMGGPVALLTWHRHRELVAGLVLCATSAHFSARRGEQLMFGTLPAMATAARFTPTVVHRRLQQRLVTGRLENDPVGRWVGRELRRSEPRMVMEAGASLGRFDARPWLSEIDVPTVVVRTRADGAVPPARQTRLAEGIPGARVVDVAGDHAVCVNGAERFVPALVTACRAVAERVPSAR